MEHGIKNRIICMESHTPQRGIHPSHHPIGMKTFDFSLQIDRVEIGYLFGMRLQSPYGRTPDMVTMTSLKWAGPYASEQRWRLG